MNEIVHSAFTFANKDYAKLLQTRESYDEFLGAISKIVKLMRQNDIPYTLHDDLLVWFRSMFWMRDPKFQQAMSKFNSDTMLRARMWRLHNLCWGLSQAAHVAGDIVNVGCYEAKSTHIFCDYNRDLIKNKTLYLFDWFDAPDGEHKKSNHGPQLADEVSKRMEDFFNIVVSGDVFKTIPVHLPDQIAFAHLDLNGYEAEAHVMPELYYRMATGGVLIFDDYGFDRYRDSGLAHQDFLRNKPEKILELPTGQGVMVKL